MGVLTVRVYGILIDKELGVLVSDEWIRGGFYTKFPGGGLEMGEGTRDCLRRECMEELGLAVEVGEHIYTTDFYQESAFRKGDQILSIYYYIHPLEPYRFAVKKEAFDFDAAQTKHYEETGEIESFRFVPAAQFDEHAVTLPIDKIVAAMVTKSL